VIRRSYGRRRTGSNRGTLAGLRRTGKELQGEDRLRPRSEEGEVANRDDVRVVSVERGRRRRHEAEPGDPAKHGAGRRPSFLLQP
jgi:hypothetical protein